MENSILFAAAYKKRKTISVTLLCFTQTAAFVCVLALLPQIALAQTTNTSTIRGHVVDQNQAAIVDAAVAVANQVTGLPARRCKACFVIRSPIQV